MGRSALVAGLVFVCSPACTAQFGVTTQPSLGGPADADANAVVDEELCGDQVDDDGDGEVDEDCGCEPGTTQSCYAGPKAKAGIGVCSPGRQQCDEHFEFPSWGPCEGSVLPSDEVAGNGVDDDCDGIVDQAPIEEEDGEEGVCPDGLTPAYRPRYEPDPYGASSIEEGDGGAPMEMTCEAVACADGEVAVEQLTWSLDDSDWSEGEWEVPSPDRSLVCVEAPPECPDGTYESYRMSPQWSEEGFGDFGGSDDRGDYGAIPEGQTGWTCELPCDLVVHYGALYGSLTVCTSEPDEMVCPNGEVPTFVFETETWECAPTCDNGLYDQIWVGDALMCVPC